jgi:phospholipase A1
MSRSALVAAALLPLFAYAQSPEPWQACTGIADAAQRLACFDHWAQSQNTPAPAPASPLAQPAKPATPQDLERTARATPPHLHMTQSEGCRDPQYSDLTRFWELERGADCGTFGLRGYRPTSLDVAKGNTVNREPTSGNPANDATVSLPYQTKEMRLQVSLRTKLVENVFTRSASSQSDSLWFGYTQQSYWQLFNPGLSRPFRSTDHEPELVYIHPLQTEKADAWRLRLWGVGLVHQSNGQSLPLSRSWNRVYLMAGIEHGPFSLQARVWQRLHEPSKHDDNPGISDYIGRGELVGNWHADRRNLFSVTLRSALHAKTRGSARIEWFRSLWDEGQGPLSGLQLHTELFTGYGDTLLDYNRRRTVFSLGFALTEW